MIYRIEKQGVIKVEDVFLYPIGENFWFLDIRTKQKYFKHNLGSFFNKKEKGISFYLYDENIEDDLTIIEIPWKDGEEVPTTCTYSQRYGLECILMNISCLEKASYIHLEKEETNELQKD